MLLLLDICGTRGPEDPDQILATLLSTPGVLRARVSANVCQADVLLADEPSTSAEQVVDRLRAAGYHALASRVPAPEEDPSYDRYYRASPDSFDWNW